MFGLETKELRPEDGRKDKRFFCVGGCMLEVIEVLVFIVIIYFLIPSKKRF